VNDMPQDLKQAQQYAEKWLGIIRNPERPEESVGKREIFQAKISSLLPNRQDWRESGWPIVRGTVIGFFLGLLPGVGAMIPTFISYAVEKRVSKHPEKFGTGMIAGVAGPEAANNAGVGGSLIPLLTLGIPGNASIAMIFVALMIHGIRPGPLLLQDLGRTVEGDQAFDLARQYEGFLPERARLEGELISAQRVPRR
jgi:TctA family transporter